MLKQLKRTLLRASRHSGVFELVGRSDWRSRRLLIIGYHGVSSDDEHLWDPAFYVAPSVLEARLASLRDGGYSVLPLGEAISRLARGSLPPKSVVLTFDDGMADFGSNAFPLLTKYGFPATVYLTSYYTAFDGPVFGMFCSYLLWKSKVATLAASEVIPDSSQTIWKLDDVPGRRLALEAIVAYATQAELSAVDKNELARRLAASLHLDYTLLAERRTMRLLSPERVSALSAAGVDFELHTHRHRTPRIRDLFVREIEENRRAIYEMTGKVAEHFCYPSGVYFPEFTGWLAAAKVRSATTCDTGICSAARNPLLLPRLIDTMNLAPIEFESWTTGVGAFLPLRPHQPTY